MQVLERRAWTTAAIATPLRARALLGLCAHRASPGSHCRSLAGFAPWHRPLAVASHRQFLLVGRDLRCAAGCPPSRQLSGDRKAGAGERHEGANQVLKLGKAWSDVPDGCTLPEGAEVRIDIESGRKQARLAENTASSVNDVRSVSEDMGALGCETLAADAEPGAQAVELTPMEKALAFAARFDPPEHLRKKFPGGLVGTLALHFKANIGLLQRIWGGFSVRVLRNLDPLFDVEEFVDGAVAAYRVIRHIAANGRTHEELQLMGPMVSAELQTQVLGNMENLSAPQRNTNTRVHDVYAEVINVTMMLDRGISAAGPADSSEAAGTKTPWSTVDNAHKRGMMLLDKGEWVQIKVRFVAMEEEVLVGDGVGETVIGFQARASTWVFQGRVWVMESRDTTSESLEQATPADQFQAFQDRRRPNPDLAWRLTAIAPE